jgi:hypothetical protein
MAWGFRADKRPELERLAANAEEIFCAMPRDAQRRVHETIAAIAAAAEGLKVLPDAMGAVLFEIVICFFRQRVSPVNRPTVKVQLKSLTKGSPTLLGPYERHAETLSEAA